MNSNKIIFQIIFFLSISIIYSSNKIQLLSNNSYYYDEKYFRLLTNNYEEILQGNFWEKFTSDGIGFKNNFGSIILLKDWSMYNFKLSHVLFRNECSFEYEDFNCSMEMWLYHTKDNQYYPPGRRIFLKENFFIIVVPFLESDSGNPANDLILDYLNLGRYEDIYQNSNAKITPKKPVKLHQIIQNQPSYLFEGKYNHTDTLFMVFTQYHFISKNYVDDLKNINTTGINLNITIESKIYRNVRKLEEIKPKATLMAYSKGTYLRNIFAFIFLFLI